MTGFCRGYAYRMLRGTTWSSPPVNTADVTRSFCSRTPTHPRVMTSYTRVKYRRFSFITQFIRIYLFTGHSDMRNPLCAVPFGSARTARGHLGVFRAGRGSIGEKVIRRSSFLVRQIPSFHLACYVSKWILVDYELQKDDRWHV